MSTTVVPEKTSPFSKKNLVLAGALIAVVGLVVAGIHWWSVGRFIESTDDAYVRADVVTISSRVPGYVTGVDVDDNQPVHKGDVLAHIDSADYAAKVARAQATVDTALATLHAEQANVATLDAQIAQQGSVMEAARADVDAARAGANRRKSDAQRYRQLAAEQASSTQRWEQAHADALTADAELARAAATAQAQRGQQTVLEKRRAQGMAAIEQAQGQLEVARAALSLAQIDLEHTTIRAASDGTVGQRTVRVGQYVETGQPLLAVVPLQDVYVIANFKETEVAAMSAGQAVDIDVDTYAGHPLRGRVLSIAPGSGAQFALLPPDNATGNFTKVVQRIPVKIQVDAGQHDAISLRPGMSVIARVHTGAPVTQPAASRS
ncbi:HlyD family secretion protein [Paraburkholderia fungorum]|uniref:Hemolysin D n=1 Tax=Paraburkholderia fungorum TaxID=134537 RepID=A0A420GWL5_9BURK|nr:HlyD family secretion protein [Paraburkholderia fungorum]RKF49518.1 hemolysin D [Paraburkholderia fungorum]